MRILVLGATGMLGHRLVLDLAARGHDVAGTVRDRAERYAQHPVLGGRNLLGEVRAEQLDSVLGALAAFRPEAVINCIGIIKQLPQAKDPLVSIGINSYFPHRLAQACRAAGARLVHISTDCVFTGRQGNYVETDSSDAEDLYGRSKFLGEVPGPGAVTLRTSIIGRELHSSLSLIDWFLGQRGQRIRGFERAIFTGFTTFELVRLIERVLTRHPELEGLWHVSMDPINKYELLVLCNQAFQAEVSIDRDTGVVCDRSLNSERFRRATGYQPPSWPDLVAELASDSTPYPKG